MAGSSLVLRLVLARTQFSLECLVLVLRCGVTAGIFPTIAGSVFPPTILWTLQEILLLTKGTEGTVDRGNLCMCRLLLCLFFCRNRNQLEFSSGVF